MIEIFTERTVLVEFFGWQVRWYGVLYVVALWLAWWWLPKLQRYRNLILSEEDWNLILIWAVVGLLAGGRLGYVLFYEPGFYLHNLGQVFAIWHGGMSSHGGFIGVGLALWLTLQRICGQLYVDANKTNTRCLIFGFRVGDVVVILVAVGLALGRFGNWINQELYPGNLALVAVAKDLVIAGVCYAGLRGKVAFLNSPGRVTATFLILYAVLRFVTEYIRILEWPMTAGLTRGQLLTIPVLVVGIWVWVRKKRDTGV